MCWKKEYILFPLPQIAISNYYVEKLKFFIHMLLFAEILEYRILAINEFLSKCSFLFVCLFLMQIQNVHFALEILS